MSESSVQGHLKKDAKEESAVCKEYNAPIKGKGWSATGLITHVKNEDNLEMTVIFNTKASGNGE